MFQKIIFLFLLFPLPFFVAHDDEKVVVTSEKATAADTLIRREAVIDYAKNFLGKPYCYSCSNPDKGFDCSGFVQYVYKNFNISVPRSSSQYVAIGASLKPEEFKIGDVLVFYGYRNSTSIGHVGIICEANGMSSKFIHSSSGKVKGVVISELNSEMYTRRFYKCIDVIGEK
jgi:cell wall-associated NlpC family hydrolase